MKKVLSSFLTMFLVFGSLPAFAASTYKYELQIQDEFGNQILSGATVRVKTAGTNTDASVWPTDDTTTGTLTGAVTPSSTTGIARWYSTSSSHDVIVHYRGKVYAYIGMTPNSDHRVEVEKFDAAIDLDTEAVASASTITLPLRGNFFQVTGTTNIDNITSTGVQVGREVTLLFGVGSALQIGQNGNISLGRGSGSLMNAPTAGLKGSLLIGAGTLIKFKWDGTAWRSY